MKRTTLAALLVGALMLPAFAAALAQGESMSMDEEMEAPPVPQFTPAEETADSDAMPAVPEKPIVVIETSMGAIKAELWPDKAPLTVQNFLTYVDEDYFDGLIFHRVIDNFMIQGGGFTPDMQKRPTRAPIKNEARKDAPNARGTLAMARTMEVDSATSQFFINLVDNRALDHEVRDFGYCVFGKVVDGMDVVDKIAKTPTGRVGPYSDVPREPVLIKDIRRAQ